MNEGQVTPPESVVASIVAGALPELAGVRVTRLVSAGTVNALYRIGEQVVARFPLVPDAGRAQHEALVAEHAALVLIGTVSPCAVPMPVAIGEPGELYDGFWSVLRWIDGESVESFDKPMSYQFATQLGSFVSAISAIPTNARRWNGQSRGGPLSTRNEDVMGALAASRLEAVLDPTILDAVTDVWRSCLDAAPASSDRWIHGDLMPGNLIHEHGDLAAVIDFGCAAVGDQAVDLMVAWNLLDDETRPAFREVVKVDDDTWERGRGWAIVQAAVALPYYAQTNQVMASTARRTLEAVLR